MSTQIQPTPIVTGEKAKEIEEWLKEELGSNYCQDKANGLVSCDGCHDKDCPLIKKGDK